MPRLRASGLGAGFLGLVGFWCVGVLGGRSWVHSVGSKALGLKALSRFCVGFVCRALGVGFGCWILGSGFRLAKILGLSGGCWASGFGLAVWVLSFGFGFRVPHVDIHLSWGRRQASAL